MATDDECLGSLSFANYYFALFDGILPGLEDHLAEDVVFTWFGTIVKGRGAVVDFIRPDEASTLHTFDEIFPTTKSFEEIYYRRDTTESPDDEKLELLKAVPKTEVALFNSDRIDKTDFEKLLRWTALQGKNIEASEIEKSEEGQGKTVWQEVIEKIKDAFEKMIREIDKMRAKKIVEARRSDAKSSCSSLTLTAIEDGGLKYIEAHGYVQFTKKTPRQGALTCPIPNASKLYCYLQISYYHQVDRGPVNELFAFCDLPIQQIHNYQIYSILYDYRSSAM